MILYIDGMGHYATDEIPKKYTAMSQITGTSFEIVPEGRFRNCVKKTVTTPGGLSWESAGYLDVTPLMVQNSSWTQTTSGVVGFALKVNRLDAVGGGLHHSTILEVLDGPNSMIDIGLNRTGTFSAYVHAKLLTGDGPALLANSIQGIRANVWAFVEIKWNVTPEPWGFGYVNPAGFIIIKVNEVEVLRYEGVNGPSTWGLHYSHYWSTVRLLNTGNNEGPSKPLTFYMGDLYVADLEGSGDEVRDFTGDITIDYIVPDGVGYTTGWTPLAGVNWNQINEVPPDEGASYISATTPGTRDSYTMQDVPPGTEPVCYQALVYARKETEGAATLKPTMRSYGTTYDANAQGVSTPDEYRYLIQPYDTNPATGAKITEAEINAAEFGVVKVR